MKAYTCKLRICIPCVWLVGWFGFNGPLRQDFSLYRASPKEREKEERKER